MCKSVNQLAFYTLTACWCLCSWWSFACPLSCPPSQPCWSHTTSDASTCPWLWPVLQRKQNITLIYDRNNKYSEEPSRSHRDRTYTTRDHDNEHEHHLLHVRHEPCTPLIGHGFLQYRTGRPLEIAEKRLETKWLSMLIDKLKIVPWSATESRERTSFTLSGTGNSGMMSKLWGTIDAKDAKARRCCV